MDILIVTKTLDINQNNHSFLVSDINDVDYLSLVKNITESSHNNFLVLNTVDGILAIRIQEIAWVKIINKCLQESSNDI